VVVQARVADVVDGDTIDLYDGTRVRLAIVDTPEIHGGVEACGAEAAEFTGDFLAGQSVAIYRPDGAPRTDRHGRTLGEVVRLTDGASLNVALVQSGLGTIDRRFVDEDPDLTRRLEAAAELAPIPTCAS
jgi:micrococcal nuclease